MKSLTFIFAALYGLFTLCSCTHTLYSHQQVLQKCHTSQDVLVQFGPPDEINPGIGVKQWVYNMDKARAKPKKNVGVQTMPDTLIKDSLQYVKQDKYARYVKFMFDDTGNIVGYKTNGVDLATKKKDSFGKSLVNVTGAILIVSALVALELYKDGAFDN